jgi:hypothetical protein
MDVYWQSRDFWLERLGALNEIVGPQGGLREPSDTVRPELVLFVRQELASWCRKSIQALDHRRLEHSLFEPDSSVYRSVLQRLETVALDFPQSTAVQKNLIVGILGHGLLGNLDEHILELGEIAQALDPLCAEGARSYCTQETSVTASRWGAADGFAQYLLGRARNAGSIPKNLRALQELVSVEIDHDLERRRTIPLNDLLDQCLRKWKEAGPLAQLVDGTSSGAGAGAACLDYSDAVFLGLALKELAQNNENYGEPNRTPLVGLCGLLPEDPSALNAFSLEFYYREAIRKQAAKRLHWLRVHGLQQPSRPWPDRQVASHGTGLYLANLAASIVGWKLEISKLDEPSNSVEFILARTEARG